MPWTRKEKYFALQLIRRQNHSKLSQIRCNTNDNALLVRQETQKTITSHGS